MGWVSMSEDIEERQIDARVRAPNNERRTKTIRGHGRTVRELRLDRIRQRPTDARSVSTMVPAGTPTTEMPSAAPNVGARSRRPLQIRSEVFAVIERGRVVHRGLYPSFEEASAREAILARQGRSVQVKSLPAALGNMFRQRLLTNH